jgi:chorismate lyase / 3-hydroxybenzoate synthase
MGSESALKLDYLSRAELAERPAAWWQCVLGLAAFDAAAPLPPTPRIPIVAVQTPVLDANARRFEVWSSAATARSGELGRTQYRHTANVVFGCLTILESALPSTAGAVSALHSATESAYSEIFAVLDALGMPHLMRVWNYLPDINSETHGSDRYWQFNSARQDAFIAGGRTIIGAVPAACGVGAPPGTPLIIYFLGGSNVPTAIENPRQVSAYNYPPEYSPRSPTFARACTVNIGGGRVLFISGTASILGHATVHGGDAAAQTRETLRNIEALLDEANRTTRPAAPFTIGSLCYKAYVRHPDDFAAIDSVLRAGLGAGPQILYLHAELCRQDLLVEIEATGCSSGSG